MLAKTGHSAWRIASAILLVLVSHGCVSRPTTFGNSTDAVPLWAQLREGLEVFVGNDPGADTQVVCSRLEDIVQSAPSATSHCWNVARGTPGTVIRIVASPSWDPQRAYGDFPYVELKAAHGAWRGFTSAVTLQPKIPVGTVLLMRSLETPITLEPRPRFQKASGPLLGDSVTVKVLQYHPEVVGGFNLYVEVQSGEYRGRRGWMYTGSAAVLQGAGFGPYGIKYKNEVD